jgi:hypothetical protein
MKAYLNELSKKYTYIFLIVYFVFFLIILIGLFFYLPNSSNSQIVLDSGKLSVFMSLS